MGKIGSGFTTGSVPIYIGNKPLAFADDMEILVVKLVVLFQHIRVGFRNSNANRDAKLLQRLRSLHHGATVPFIQVILSPVVLRVKYFFCGELNLMFTTSV